VLDVNENRGIPDAETTIAQMLKPAGYSTMCVGKWHVGSVPQYFPNNRGFDEWYGIPYSIDQGTRPLMHNFDVIEEPSNLNNLTQRYTQWAMDYIRRSAKSPFFLYMAHAFPHLPLAASQPFLGKSFHGLYGDAVQEIDWSTGQILGALAAAGVDADTLVMFTSDHGPWYQGSPGGLRGRKGDTFEGGFRVPFVARYPGFIPGGQVSSALVSTLDILPTVGRMAGAALPGNPLDGVDLGAVMSGRESGVPRDAFLYFNDVYLQAARLGNWKLHVARFNMPAFTTPPARGRMNLPLPQPEMYDMQTDPDESHDRGDRNPATVGQIRAEMDRLIQSFPADIQDAWNSTFTQNVQGTPSGCYPVPSGS
jgi:arylsulfatase A-like enzyme